MVAEVTRVLVRKASTDLLIMGCSKRKRPDSALLPALERYDGPLFRVLRKYLRSPESQQRYLHTYVLSAQFGLIPASLPIPNYDCRMTRQRAIELMEQVVPRLTDLIGERQYHEFHLCLGREYLRCLQGYESVLPRSVKVTVAEGPMGKRQFNLWRWLYKDAAKRERLNRSRLATDTGVATIRGVGVNLSPDEVIATGQASLLQSQGCPDNFQAWYVKIGEKRVSSKWLVGQITGLPVSTFSSGEARRLLAKLGVEVHSL